MQWDNPIPVSVVLQPVRVDGAVGLMVVRRAIAPQAGKLALVGGFLEAHERWQEGGAREVFEETGVQIVASGLRPFWYVSTEPRHNRVLLFSVADVLDASVLAPFVTSAETNERGVIFGAEGLDEVFAFGLHQEAASRFFAERSVRAPHAYRPLP